jgi:RNA polymerase sigma-70 factor (ECF subfamily)
LIVRRVKIVVMVERASVESVEANEGTALRGLLAGEYPRLLRVAVLICRDHHDAQDAVQAALERAWRNHGALRDPDRLAAWLHRIVVREAIRSEGRRRALFGRWLSRPQEIDVAGDRADVGDLDLRSALDALSVEQRAVLVLHYYAGYTVAETASLCGIGYETARSRLRLGRARLGAALLGESR